MAGRAAPVHVLIAGGGVAALEATLALRAHAEERVAITLVAPESEFSYRPLAVAEPFRVGAVRRFPLRPLVEAAGGCRSRSDGSHCTGHRGCGAPPQLAVGPNGGAIAAWLVHTPNQTSAGASLQATAFASPHG